jgi:hypothetical protein
MLPPNGEGEASRGARQAPRAAHVLQRLRRVTTSGSRSPPTIVRLLAHAGSSTRPKR